MSKITQCLYGLWHNGWCGFKTTFNPDRIGYGYAGTMQEAKAGKAVFVSEGQSEESYTVVVFSPSQDPIELVAKPSRAQLQALEYVESTGTTNGSHRIAGVTFTAIFKRGWVTSNVMADGQEEPKRPLRLTEAGRLRLVDGKCQNCKKAWANPLGPCPYQQEINGDNSDHCNCCEDCSRNCADEV